MKEILIKLNACRGAIEWVGDRTIEQAVADCHRGDWLLWLASKLEIDRRKITLAKGLCANTVRHLMTDDRSKNAVDAAIAYGKGDIGEEELADAALTAATAALTAYNALPASAALAASAAVYAASADAYNVVVGAALTAARAENQKQTADICREILGEEIITKFNQL